MKLVDAAMLLAIKYHDGQVNKHDGEVYVLHCARVWANVRDAGGGEAAQAVAWLHDVLEDCDVDEIQLTADLKELTENPYVDVVVTACDVISKRKGESNKEYYNRVNKNFVARFVKKHGDIVDNFRRVHVIDDPDTRLRLLQKYSMGMDILHN